MKTVGSLVASSHYFIQIGYGNNYPHIAVDDVVLTFEQTGGPSPSPSPAPSAGSGAAGDAFTCYDTGAANMVRCVAPAPDGIGVAPTGVGPLADNPNIRACVAQSNGSYVCQGDKPVAGSPSPSPSASAGPYAPGGGSSVGGGSQVCQRAEQLLAARIAQGVPYCWGSRDPDKPIEQQGYTTGDLCPAGRGLDCSGAIIWAWRQAGVNVPNGTAQDLYNQLPHVACTLADLTRTASDAGGCWAVGDLIFLGHGGVTNDIYHVAGYAGGGLWTDCYNTSTGCQVWSITDKAPYTTDFVGAARPSLAWGGGSCGDGGSVSAGGAGAGSGLGAVGTGAIQSALKPLYNKEPVGTLLDTANYMRGVGLVIANPDITPAITAGPSYVGPAQGSLSFLSFDTYMSGVVWFFNWLADKLEATSYGPINGLDLIRLGFDIACVSMVIVGIRRSVVVAA